MNVVMLDYGAGNTQSVEFALNRLGLVSTLSSDPETIRSADKVIVPGVGQARTAMRELNKLGLAELIPTLKQDVLGICLGMQLMCSSSEEGDIELLNIIETGVYAFPPIENSPQIGWNSLDYTNDKLFNDVKDRSFVYYVNGFYVNVNPFTIATSSYGVPFSAAIRKDNFWGVQFHPEKSGAVGSQILKNFLAS